MTVPTPDASSSTTSGSTRVDRMSSCWGSRRERAYRDGRPPLDLTGCTTLLIDDGLATGSSMRAAVAALRHRDPTAVVVAVPIAPPQTCETLAREADAVVCAHTSEPFLAVGAWYETFDQTTDDEVHALLAQARAATSAHPAEHDA